MLVNNSVLDNVEEKQNREQSVKMWLGELPNLAYDVDDLDEFETKALSRSYCFRNQLLLSNPVLVSFISSF